MIEIILGLMIGLILGMAMFLLKSELTYISITICIVIMSLTNFVLNSKNVSRSHDNNVVRGGRVKMHNDFPTNYFSRDDSKHKKVQTNHSKDVMQILNTGRFNEPVSHYPSKPEKSTSFSRILDLSKTMPYKRSRGEYKPQLHWVS